MVKYSSSVDVADYTLHLWSSTAYRLDSRYFNSQLIYSSASFINYWKVPLIGDEHEADDDLSHLISTMTESRD